MAKEKTTQLIALEEAIAEIKRKSFINQYNSQVSLAGLHRFTIPVSDVRLSPVDRYSNTGKSLKASFDVGIDFIHRSKRLAYRRSEYYGREITPFDASNNFDLFKYNYMVFIDDHLIDYVSLVTNKGSLTIFFQVRYDDNGVGIPYTEFKSLQEDDNTTINVLFFPNVNYGVYNTDIDELSKYQSHLNIPEQYDGLPSALDDEVTYMAFVNDNKLFTKSRFVTPNSESLTRFREDVESYKHAHINIFGFRHLHDVMEINSSDKFFRIEGLKMPLPTENILIFRKVNDQLTFAYDVDIKLYYPNVYEILNAGDNEQLILYMFYSQDSSGTTGYNNELEVYHKYMGTDPIDYLSGMVHPLAVNYMPEKYTYSIPDYNEYYGYPDHTFYKILRFNDWMVNNPNLMSAFLRANVEDYEGYYLEMKYVDLPSKVRHDNHSEVVASYHREEFDEPHYVFILKNDGMTNMTFRFYIEGEFYVPEYSWIIGKYEYFYIPTRLVDEDTIIEIEKFRNLHKEKDILFLRLTDYKEIDFSGEKFRKNDIFVTDLSDSERFISKDDYEISYMLGDKRIVFVSDSFEEVPDGIFHIRLKNPDLLGKDLRVYAKRTSHMIEREIEVSSATKTVRYKANYSDDPRQIRIFRNSRLLSQDLYTLRMPRYYGAVTSVDPGIMKYKGDRYTIDITPNKYVVVHEQATIPEHGVIDLRGKIKKTIDLSWYDIYLNGRRLSKKEVEIISPSIIAIRNVKSLKNFVIIERDRHMKTDVFSKDMSTVVEKLLDEDNEFRNRVYGKSRDNVDEEEDIITEIVSALDIEYANIVNELMNRLEIINPDTRQVHTDWKDSAPIILKNDFIIRINPDDGLPDTSVTEINPNKDIEYIEPEELD